MPKDKTTFDTKQQIENDRVREAASDKAKPMCSVCGKYTDKKTPPMCFGHESGSSSPGESAGKDSGGTQIDSGSGKSTDTYSQASTHHSEISTVTALSFNTEIVQSPFNAEIISELLSKRLLLIDNDRELGTLTIKLLCNFKDLSPEQREQFKLFINTIINELEDFKKENGISSNCKLVEQDKDGNIISLRIALPTPTHYDAFIKRLANKNLLPKQNIEQKAKEKVKYPEHSNHFNPTPFSTKPTPSVGKKEVVDEEAHKTNKQRTSQRRSSIRPKSLLDGLKPKG